MFKTFRLSSKIRFVPPKANCIINPQYETNKRWEEQERSKIKRNYEILDTSEFAKAMDESKKLEDQSYYHK